MLPGMVSAAAYLAVFTARPLKHEYFKLATASKEGGRPALAGGLRRELLAESADEDDEEAVRGNVSPKEEILRGKAAGLHTHTRGCATFLVMLPFWSNEGGLLWLCTV